jgi:hypothetical protein
MSSSEFASFRGRDELPIRDFRYRSLTVAAQ